jgi:hypothetical protein
VVVDTEEEFDWSNGFSRANTAVGSLRAIERFQRMLDEFKIVPVYVVDYPVASDADGCQVLVEIHADGRCVIGSHLHPWVNPPYTEPVSPYNSFPGNLPRALEAEKLRVLGETIAERFGERPVIYKAGRYGIGPHTAEVLDEQGYEIDLSVCPQMDYSAEGGPDFTGSTASPYWFGKRPLLELPLTVGFVGWLRQWGGPLHRMAGARALVPFRLPGLLARLGMVNKVWLSPEGYHGEELRALVSALCADGHGIFSFALHSPSLEAGHTPYVTCQRELDDFLGRCRQFFEFFIGDKGGVPATPLEIKAQLTVASVRKGQTPETLRTPRISLDASSNSANSASLR